MMISNKIDLIKIFINIKRGIFFLILTVYSGLIYKIKLTKDYILQIMLVDFYLYSLLFFLKDHSLCLFKLLIDLVVYEFLGNLFRFILVYNLLSLKFSVRLFIKIKLQELNSFFLSNYSLFLNIAWLEREVFDFYGIYFILNKDLRRLLLDYGFSGFPLRKDFPLSGFLEVALVKFF